MQTTSNGSHLLVNEDKISYEVDKADAAIWNLCDDITFEQLRDSISSKLGWQIPADVLSHIERFVNWCIWAKLIEVRDFTPSHFAELMQQNRIGVDALEKLTSSAEGQMRRATGN